MDQVKDDSISVCVKCRNSVAQGTSRWIASPSTLDRLRNSAQLLQSEVWDTQNDILAATGALKNVEGEITKVEEILRQLRARQEGIIDFISQKNSLMVPIRRMPVELLLKIFSHACGTNRFGYWDLIERDTPTIHISQTCHLWRSLCLTSPRLWSDTAIRFFLERPRTPLPVQYMTASDFRDDSSLLQLYLKRSQAFPLRVEIAYPNGGIHGGLASDKFSQSDRVKIEMLSEDINRWEAAELDAQALFHFSRTMDSTSQLKALILRGDENFPFDPFFTHTFAHCSHLVNVSISNIHLGHLVLPWDTIKSLRLGNMAAVNVEYLSSSVTAQIKQLELFYPTGNSFHSGTQFSFPWLQSLSVNEFPHDSTGWTLFDGLDAPNLQSLHFRSSSSELVERELAKLLSSQHSPQLNQLSLTVSSGPGLLDISCLARSLQLPKSLHVLTLDFSKKSRWNHRHTTDLLNLFQGITLPASSDSVHEDKLPLLKSLFLNIPSIELGLNEDMVSFLESRRPPKADTALLESFHFRNWRLRLVDSVRGNKNLVSRLKALRDGGLKIIINDDYGALDLCDG